MLIFCSQIYSVGQDLNLLWAKQIGRKNYDGPVTSMTVDNDGNVLTIGTFWNQGLPLDFDPNSGVVELTAYSPYGNFIQKLDKDGNLMWAKNLQVGANFFQTNSITSDKQGNSYITGKFKGTGTFGNTTLKSSGENNFDIFVIKFNASGQHVWSKHFEASFDDVAFSITTDQHQNIYLTGYVHYEYNGTSRNALFMKLDAQGSIVWSQIEGGVSDVWGYSVCTESTNEFVYFTYNLVNGNQFGSYLVKKNASDGTTLWTKALSNGNWNSNSFTRFTVITDKRGDVYVGGEFYGVLNSGIASNGLSDGACLKFSPNGQLLWATRLGSNGEDQITSISITENLEIYIAGNFENTVDFDPGTATFNLTSANTNGFIQQLDSNGNFVAAHKLDYNLSPNFEKQIFASSKYGTFVSSLFTGTRDMDPGIATSNLTSYGYTDIVVSRMIDSKDTDGDGTPDGQELQTATDPNDPCDPPKQPGYNGFDSTNTIWQAADCDGDELTNEDEINLHNTDPYNYDSDGDGVKDGEEISGNSDPLDPCDPKQQPGYTDYDSTNSIWKSQDCDGDGVNNGTEVENQTDPYGTETDEDSDGDGILDSDETNNGSDPNNPCDPKQASSYNGFDSTNQVWQAADCDEDGLTNGQELVNNTDPYNADSDGDGVIDGSEVSNGSSPLNPCDPAQDSGYTGFDTTNLVWQLVDCDSDGVLNNQEIIDGTDPYSVYNGLDLDGDGIDDGFENFNGFSSSDPCNPPQDTGYSEYNPSNTFWQKEDCDGDGISNIVEHVNGTDPYDSNNQDNVDDNKDSLKTVDETIFYDAFLITPNKDLFNDVLAFDNIESLHPENSLTIYNRWGQQVFQTFNYRNTWHGQASHNSSYQKLPQGTYYFVFESVTNNNKMTGYIYLKLNNE